MRKENLVIHLIFAKNMMKYIMFVILNNSLKSTIRSISHGSYLMLLCVAIWVLRFDGCPKALSQTVHW